MEPTIAKLPLPLLSPLKLPPLLLSWMHVWLSMNGKQWRRMRRRKRRGSQIFRKTIWWRGGQEFSINKALPLGFTTVSCLCPPPNAAHKGRSPLMQLRGAKGKCWQRGARYWTPGGLRCVYLTAWGGSNTLCSLHPQTNSPAWCLVISTVGVSLIERSNSNPELPWKHLNRALTRLWSGQRLTANVTMMTMSMVKMSLCLTWRRTTWWLEGPDHSRNRV